jgi:predicted dehydrogenase
MYGSDGGASIEWGAPDDLHRTLSIWTEKSGVPATLHPNVPPDGQHAESIKDFIAEVRSGDYSNHRGKQALARAMVIDACYASAEKGAEITLDS